MLQINGQKIWEQATLLLSIKMTMFPRFPPESELISNPVVLHVRSIYIQLFRVVMAIWDGKCVWKAWGSNKVHNQAKLSSTSCSENHRDPTLTQQNPIKEASESRQSMPQEWKHCHSVLPASPASELNI